MNRLAIKIKEARLKANMSEKDLAKACGQNINYILQIESGKKVINEQIAENILKILGSKMESFQDVPEQVKAPEISKKAPAKPAPSNQESAITPNDQWSDILSGVIKKYPIVEENSNQAVDYKEISVLGKRIEGYHYEKVFFIKATHSSLPKFRIQAGDVLTLVETHDIQNYSVYYVEIDKCKSIKQVYKSQNQEVVVSNGDSKSEVALPLKDVKIIGKVIKVEYLI